jgi:acetyltransferase-like isoleucine patch superfamily enzyme
MPTVIGEYLRLAYYSAVCTYVSPDAKLLFGSMIAHREATIRRGVVIGQGTIIGKADIGEMVLFGAGVSLLSGKYQHGRPQDRRENDPGTEEYRIIKIGSHSWIGEKSVIMADVGESCTVAAGAVLMKDAPDNTTFMGNPARKVSIAAPTVPATPPVETET